MFKNGCEPVIDDEDAAFITEAMTLLPEGPFDRETWGVWTKAVKDATGRKGRGLFMPLRKALTGMDHGPDMKAVLPLMQVIRAKG
jgi:glutamyl-tRNA synthetase